MSLPPVHTCNQMCRLSFFLAAFFTFAVSPAWADDNENTSTVHINELVTSETALPSSDQAQSHQRTYDLSDLIDITLKNNPTIEIARQKQHQNQGELTQARSGYLPRLTVGGDYTYAQQKNVPSPSGVETADNADNTESIEEDGVTHGSVTLSQLIYDFGKTGGAIDVGKSNLQAAEAYLQRQKKTIIFKVKNAYYNVLEKTRLIDVAAESVRSFSQHLNQAKTYHKAGVRTKIDVINAELALSRANMALLRANYDLKTAYVALDQVLGTKINGGTYALHRDDVNIDNVLELIPPVPGHLDSLIEGAMKQRPDVMQLDGLIKAAEANVSQVKGNYWPSIKAEARYNEYDTKLSRYNDQDGVEAGVICSWEIFSGFHTDGSTAAAQGRLLETRAQLREVQLSIASEVTESYLRASESRERVQLALQSFKLARENLSLAEKRYQTGAYDVLEFNDAQIDLSKTQSDLVVSYYGYLIALAGLEYATGI